jgi:dolichyl-phosphate beta-glucosyltransferase
MRISIIIPCYNEGKTIEQNITKVNNFFKNNKKISKYEIICVNDGSTDKTLNKLKKLKKNLPLIRINKKRKNFGKGYSVREGIFLSKYERLIFFDADLSTPLAEINKFLKEKNFDILIGSRTLSESESNRFYIRNIFGRIFSSISNIMLKINISDPQCGIKMFKSSVAKKIFKVQKMNRWSFDSEIMHIAKKMNLTIKEIPIMWSESETTRINIFKDGLIMLKDLFIIRFTNYKLDRYIKSSMH